MHLTAQAVRASGEDACSRIVHHELGHHAMLCRRVRHNGMAKVQLSRITLWQRSD